MGLSAEFGERVIKLLTDNADTGHASSPAQCEKGVRAGVYKGHGLVKVLGGDLGRARIPHARNVSQIGVAMPLGPTERAAR